MKRIAASLLMYLFDVTPAELTNENKSELALWSTVFGGTCFIAILLNLLVRFPL